jgi:hypothetical protein
MEILKRQNMREMYFSTFIATILLSLGILGLFGPAPSGGDIDFILGEYSGLKQNTEYAFGQVTTESQEMRKATIDFQLQMADPDPFREEREQILLASEVVEGAYETEGSSDKFQWLSANTVKILVTNSSLNDVRYELSYLLSETPCGVLPALTKSTLETFVRAGRLVLEGTLSSKSSETLTVQFKTTKCSIQSDSRTFYGKISNRESIGKYLNRINPQWPQTIFTTDREFQTGLSIILRNRSTLVFCLAPCENTDDDTKNKLEIPLTQGLSHHVEVKFNGHKKVLLVNVDNVRAQIPKEQVPEVLQFVTPTIGARDETRGIDSILNFNLAATPHQWERQFGVSIVILLAGISLLMSLLMSPSFKQNQNF